MDIVHEQKFENEYLGNKKLQNAFKTTLPSEETDSDCPVLEEDEENDESIFDFLR